MLSLTGWTKSADHTMMADELEAQAEATLDMIRAAVVRLLRDGGGRPPLVALCVARVAGELTGFTRRAGREHHGLVLIEREPPDPAP